MVQSSANRIPLLFMHILSYGAVCLDSQRSGNKGKISGNHAIKPIWGFATISYDIWNFLERTTEYNMWLCVCMNLIVCVGMCVYMCVCVRLSPHAAHLLIRRSASLLQSSAGTNRSPTLWWRQTQMSVLHIGSITQVLWSKHLKLFLLVMLVCSLEWCMLEKDSQWWCEGYVDWLEWLGHPPLCP